MKKHKVSIWTRQPVTRKYEKVPKSARNDWEPTPGHRFVLRYHRTYKTIDAVNYGQAKEQAAKKQAELQLAPPPEQRKVYDPRPKVATAIERYLQDIEIRQSPNTAKSYTTSLTQFQEVCTKVYLSELTTDDLKAYVASMKVKGLGDHTIAARVRNVTTFLRSVGINNVTLECRWNEKIDVPFIGIAGNHRCLY